LKIELKPNEVPYNFVGEMNEIMSAYRRLNISAEDIFAYLIWKGLNVQMQDPFINLLDKSGLCLDELVNNMCKVVRRYVRDLNTSKVIAKKVKMISIRI